MNAVLAVADRLAENLFESEIRSGRFVSGRLNNVSALYVHDGTISTPPIRRLRYNNVKEMRIYGDHEASFPREGKRFAKYGDRPVESVAVEEHPQNLVLRGKVRPSYRMRNATVNLPRRNVEGEVDNSTLYVLSPTSFSIWAEYISDEEKALLHAMEKSRTKNPREFQEIFGGLGMSALTGISTYLGGGMLYAIFVGMVATAGPGIIYSLSPNVRLTFPDGRTDIDTGAQVMKFNGKVHTGAEAHPRIETRHFGGRESLGLPDRFSIDGDFFVEGSGRFDVGKDSLDVYGGRISGVIDYENGRAFVAGNIQA